VTDSISDEDARRVDENVSADALNKEQIQRELPDTFEGNAKDAFAERVAEERSDAREAFRDQVAFRTNASSGATQIQTESGQFGPAVENVENTRVDPSDGGVYAEADGKEYRIGTVDTEDRPTQTTSARGDWS
jgi:hypothetical protein